MTTVTFTANGQPRAGYLALPESGKGSGILFLHAWWGLNDFFKRACDRLAEQGFVVFAPDLNDGKIATTIEEATQLMEQRDHPATRATAEAALSYLQMHPAVQGEKLCALGFSMGAGYTMLLDQLHPGSFAGIVSFYGLSEADFTETNTQYLCHFAELDEWEPIENVRKITAPNAKIYIYPNARHWFVEEDRPDAYDVEAARLAWERSVKFMREQTG